MRRIMKKKKKTDSEAKPSKVGRSVIEKIYQEEDEIGEEAIRVGIGRGRYALRLYEF